MSALSAPIENLDLEGMLALPLTPYATFKLVLGHGSTVRERATARGRAEILKPAKYWDRALL